MSDDIDVRFKEHILRIIELEHDLTEHRKELERHILAYDHKTVEIIELREKVADLQEQLLVLKPIVENFAQMGEDLITHLTGQIVVLNKLIKAKPIDIPVAPIKEKKKKKDKKTE